MVILECINVSKKFGGLWALKRVNIKINKGETVGLIGPNGSGKTTLINVVTGFLKPSEGRIIAFGKDITGHNPYDIAKEGVVRTFQIPKPFMRLSVLENVMIGTIMVKKSVEEAREEALNVLEFVGLYDKKDKPAQSLTVLEMKRLELAKALSARPKLLFLDEVMAGLRPTEIAEAINILNKIKDYGITLVIVEHVIKAVVTIADRVIVLESGNVIADGIPEEVISNKKVIEAYLGEGVLLA